MSDELSAGMVCFDVNGVRAAALGDRSHALAELEQAYAERSWFLDFLKTDPQMDSLRSEPRFQELLRSMNFPP